jgi:hypothetical protein
MVGKRRLDGGARRKRTVSQVEIKNARIESVYLGLESHGILTCYLNLDYGGLAQSFGGFELKHPDYGMEFIHRILRVVGVESWEQLPGKTIRAKCDNSKVYGIAHIIEPKWFHPEDLRKS